MYYDFSPFNKPLKEVTVEDLLILKKIEESWYIDYKSTPYKDSADFGKYMSSFANQYGGFIFVGVEENQTTNRAEEFIGVDTSDVSRILEKIRAAASTNVNPELHYEVQVIHGPNEDIKLAEGKSIIIIGIPKGVYPPYIHSSGKIYQRFSDSSKPFDVKEIKDRYSLDKLFNRKDEFDTAIINFINDKYKIPEEQAHIAVFELSLLCDLDNVDSDFCITYELLNEIIKNKKLLLDIPIDSFYPVNKGFFIRVVHNSKAELCLPNMFLYSDGSAKITIPIDTLFQNAFHSIYEDKNLYNAQKSCSDFCAQLNREQYKDVKIINYSILPVLIVNFLFLIKEALNKQHVDDEVTLYYSFSLENIANTVGFYHLENTYNNKERTLPFFPFKNLQIPPVIRFDTLEKIIFSRKNNTDYYDASLEIITKLFVHLGILRDKEDGSKFSHAFLVTGIKSDVSE